MLLLLLLVCCTWLELRQRWTLLDCLLAAPLSSAEEKELQVLLLSSELSIRDIIASQHNGQLSDSVSSGLA